MPEQEKQNPAGLRQAASGIPASSSASAPCASSCDITVPDGALPCRLDAALAVMFPGFGLRARRRLWDWRRVTVNGHPRPPGHTVMPGDHIRLEAPAGHAHSAAPGARLVFLNDDYAVFDKPDGLHSAHIEGGGGCSLESLLPDIWPDLWTGWLREGGETAAAPLPPAPAPFLTRLDSGTSGLVVAARGLAAAEHFRREEKAGRVRKSYLALVRGRLEGELALRPALDTARRAKTLVLERDDPDENRHSFVRPLAYARMREGVPEASAEGDLTLARVDIRRGARHQIRAHLAHAGWPLLGEALYAPPPALGDGEAGGRLFLHHALLRTDGFTAQSLPPWAADLSFFL